MIQKPQIKTTIHRPGHIQTQPTNDAFREGFDAIDWSRKDASPTDDARRGYTVRIGKLSPNRYR